LTRYSPGLGCCAPDFGNGTWGSAAALYGAVYAILGLGLPAVLVTVCNLRVLGIARYHRHRIASAIYEVTLSAQVTITHQRNPFFVPTVTAPSAAGPPRFRSAASTVRKVSMFRSYSFVISGIGIRHREVTFFLVMPADRRDLWDKPRSIVTRQEYSGRIWLAESTDLS
jgi:hypothetical protein